MEAIGHEAETALTKKTHRYKINDKSRPPLQGGEGLNVV